MDLNPLFNGLNFALYCPVVAHLGAMSSYNHRKPRKGLIHGKRQDPKEKNRSPRLTEIKWLPPQSHDINLPWWGTKRLRMLRRLPLEGRLMSGTVWQVLNTRVSVAQTVGSWDCRRASFFTTQHGCGSTPRSHLTRTHSHTRPIMHTDKKWQTEPFEQQERQVTLSLRLLIIIPDHLAWDTTLCGALFKSSQF